MICTHFPAATHQLHKPGNMEDEECRTAPAAIGVDGRFPCFVTAWRPTPQELEELNNGGMVYLHIVSNGLPPHYLATRIYARLRDGEGVLQDGPPEHWEPNMEVFRNGYNASAHGLTLAENPHPKDAPEHYDWQYGFQWWKALHVGE